MRHRACTCLLVAIVAAGASAGAKKPELVSTWREVDITVDGDDEEWPGGAKLLIDAPMAVGVSNDNEFVYVRVRSTDQALGTKILAAGFTVWFDPAGGDKRVFGIRYPLGRRGPRGDWPGGPPGTTDLPLGEGRGTPGDRRGERQPPALDPAKVVAPSLDVLGPGKDDVRRFDQSRRPRGIDVAIARVEDALVYELKVPLARPAEDPVGIGAKPGALIGVTFETTKVEPPAVQGRGGMGGPGGGMGGPGGGMGGPGGGMGGPGGMRGPADTVKQLKVWTPVRLAGPR